MSEAYKGLRRRRKRTHPSKCPCCTTDQEGEPENEGNAGSENHNEVIKDVRQSKRKRTPKKKEDESKSDSESSELNSTATPSEKPPPKKRKLRNAREESPSQDILPNKDSTKKATKAVSLTNKAKNSKEIIKVEKTVEKSKAKKTGNNKNGNSTNVKKDSKSTKKISKTQLHDSNEEYASDVEEVVLISKVERCKSSSSNDNDIKKKKTDNNGKSKGSSKSKTNASTKKDSDVDVLTSQESDNQILRTAKKVKKSVTKNVAKGKTASRMPIEKPLAVTKPSQKKSKSVTPSFITQTKIMAFDNLYDKLRSTYGNTNLRIEEAAEMLVKISCECLHVALKSSLKTDNREKNLQIFSRNRGNITQHEGKGISDTEEIVSQAAEALVSFRSKSPLTREDSKTEKPASSSQGLQCTASAPQNTWQTGEKAKLHTNTAAFTSSQAVQALMQIQTPCSFPSQVFTTTPVTASLPQNILHGMHSMPQSYPQLLPSTITTSFTNLMPMVNSHGTLPSFSQIASHLRPPPVMTGGVQPALLNAGLPNPNMPTASAMLTNQALLQPQLQQPSPMPSPVTSNKPTLTTLTTMKPVVQPVEPTGSKANTQAQNPLQQPLKGMEEVIGNVGSNIPPPYVLNIKSPVVFLGSPQNLGGVPRNLMANPCNQATINSEQSGYPPVAPRPVSKSDALRMNPGNVSSVPNMLTLGGRPILPRTQVQCGDDSKLRVQSIAPQPGMPHIVQHSGLSSSSPHPCTASTLAVQPALTQVTSANIKKTTLVTVNIPSSSSQMSPLPNFIHQNIQENPAAEGLSPSSVAAKQAVKKLVHERTKSAELKREASGLANPTSKLKAILPLPPKEPSILPSTASVTSNPESGSKNNEFNIEQAATALLSIGVPDGIESIGLKHSTSELSKEDHNEDVVFTSKGTFRVGDVDVDPRYNRIEGYTCGKCNKIFTSLSYLARHIKRVCPDMSCRKWKCTLCDKAFRHPFGLQQHVYTHTGERPHKCPLCPKAFYSSNDLRRHSRIHSGERPYRCKHCDKSFATTISLKTHTYIHTGEKPHKCPQCPKTFATSSKLGRHIVTHSEQRPFSCDQCPKSFNRSGDLRRHNLAVHDGKEKSFDCDLCPATFSKPAGLRRHNTTLHQRPPKTMECEDCGTQFSTPICLKMHRDTYHKNPSTTTTAEADKIFTCDMCGKTYSSAALLTKHKVTHEPSSTTGYNPSQFQHIAPKPVEQTTVESGS